MKRILIVIMIIVIAVIIVIDVATGKPSAISSSPIATDTQQETLSEACPIDEQYYLTSISKTSYTLNRMITELEGLLVNPQLDNDEWTNKVAEQFVIILTEYEKTTQLIPPSCLVDVHNKFILGMDYLNEMTYLLTEGIDNANSDLIEEANRKLNEGARLISEAVGLMNDSNEVYG
jgi:hypothetical protein